MEISKKALISTVIIDLLLLVVGVICLFVTKFATWSLIVFMAVVFMVLVTSILVWKYGKAYKK